jgi:hypothetical protein
MWFLGLAGCLLLEKAQENVENVTDVIGDVTERTVLQGSIIGVEASADPQITEILTAAGLSAGTSATAFVADAAASSEMSNGLVSGAGVTVEGVALAEDAATPGLYLMTPDQGPAYAAGDTWTLEVDRGDAVLRTATVTLPPPAPDGVVDDSGPGGSVQLRAGEGMSIDLSGIGFQSSLVVVVSADGQATFTNEPTSIDEVYQMSQSDDAGVVQIPGSAFPSPGTYVLGVAGLANNTGADHEGFNTLLSRVRAGMLQHWAVIVTP